MNALLVDCYNIGHIAFHSMGELDYHGRRTGVMYGFMLHVLRLAKAFHPCKFIFCWDSRRNARRLMYQGYKEKRKTADLDPSKALDYEALHEQLGELRTELLPRLGFANNIMYAGLEADDVIALVIKNGKVPGGWGRVKWVVVSTDRDLYQLLAPDVCIYSAKSKETFTEEKFMRLYGIAPAKWADAKALGGCDGDSVVGIHGVADPAKSVNSRAIRYLRGELRGKFADIIESKAGQRIYRRNLTLVSLPLNTGLYPEVSDYELARGTFIEVFDELGFASFLRKEQLTQWETYLELN